MYFDSCSIIWHLSWIVYGLFTYVAEKNGLCHVGKFISFVCLAWWHFQSSSYWRSQFFGSPLTYLDKVRRTIYHYLHILSVYHIPFIVSLKFPKFRSNLFQWCSQRENMQLKAVFGSSFSNHYCFIVSRKKLEPWITTYPGKAHLRWLLPLFRNQV